MKIIKAYEKLKKYLKKDKTNKEKLNKLFQLRDELLVKRKTVPEDKEVMDSLIKKIDKKIKKIKELNKD